MSHRTEPGARDARDALPCVVRTVVEIAAPPAEVFEALTDPRELAAWWPADGARTLDCESDARAGGTWRVRTVGPDGVERTVGGEYRVVDPPHRLEQTWQGPDDAAPSRVRYDLEPIPMEGAEGTRLTVTHTSPTAVASGAATTMRLRILSRFAARRYEPVWCRVSHRPAWFARAGVAQLP
jgi:uncharacterized protein YndB with AHSA1/START domain